MSLREAMLIFPAVGPLRAFAPLSAFGFQKPSSSQPADGRLSLRLHYSRREQPRMVLIAVSTKQSKVDRRRPLSHSLFFSYALTESGGRCHRLPPVFYTIECRLLLCFSLPLQRNVK